MTGKCARKWGNLITHNVSEVHHKPDVINAVTLPISFHAGEANTMFCCRWSVWFLCKDPSQCCSQEIHPLWRKFPACLPPSSLPLLGGEFPCLSLISCLSHLQSVLGKNKGCLELCRVLAAFGNQRCKLWSGQSHSSSFIPQIRGNSSVLFS